MGSNQPDIKAGGGRIAQCLKQHQAELSPACKSKAPAAKEKAEKVREACKADAATLCKDVKPGGGRIVVCLRQHEAELSDDCKDALPHRR